MSEQATVQRKPTKVLLAAVAVAVCAVVAVIIVRSRQRTDEANLPVVKVNIVTWAGFGPVFLAQEKGYFKEEGVQQFPEPDKQRQIPS